MSEDKNHKIYEIPLNNGKKMQIRQGAFGSGEHETTKACIAFLQSIDLTGKKILDVGCGTGILGIAASLLGAEYIIGFDIFHSACATAKFCNELNGVTNNHIVCSYNTAINGKFDLIAANIYQDILIMLKEFHNDSLVDGGILMMSGIPIEENYDVAKHYESMGYTVIQNMRHEDFSTIIMQKP